MDASYEAEGTAATVSQPSGNGMRVKDLIAHLGRMDPDLDVLAHAGHGDGVYSFFDIAAADLANAARSRDSSGTPQVVLDADGRPLVLLTLTSDF